MLEIGAGTGNVTRRLIELGASSIVAVEPDAVLAKYLISTCPDAAVRVEAFEDAALPESSFNLSIAATAFHWIEQESGLRKVRGLLRPGGWWAMWWNVFGDPDREDAFHEATKELLSSLAESPSHGETGRPLFALDVETRESDLAMAGFENVQHEQMPWTLTLDTSETKELYATYGAINRLASSDRERVLDEIARIADTQFGGRVERNMITAVYTARAPG